MLNLFLKIQKKLTYPLSDFFRVAAMLFVVFMTLIAIKIGGFFSPNKGSVQVVENTQLAEKNIYLDEKSETIKKLTS